MVKLASMYLHGTSKEEKCSFKMTKMHENLFNSGLNHNQGFVSLIANSIFQYNSKLCSL